MRRHLWIAALLLAAAVAPVPGPAVAAESVPAVEPLGEAVLTKCRDWLVASSCRRYHHIRLPPRVAVGDKVTLSFGSSPKQYAFPVVRIVLGRHRCTIFDTPAESRGRDKLRVRCRPADPAR